MDQGLRALAAPTEDLSGILSTYMRGISQRSVAPVAGAPCPLLAPTGTCCTYIHASKQNTHT